MGNNLREAECTDFIIRIKSRIRYQLKWSCPQNVTLDTIEKMYSENSNRFRKTAIDTNGHAWKIKIYIKLKYNIISFLISFFKKTEGTCTSHLQHRLTGLTFLWLLMSLRFVRTFLWLQISYFYCIFFLLAIKFELFSSMGFILSLFAGNKLTYTFTIRVFSSAIGTKFSCWTISDRI